MIVRRVDNALNISSIGRMRALATGGRNMSIPTVTPVTLTTTTPQTSGRGRRVWSWLLLIVGVSVTSASVGQWMITRRQGREDAQQQLVLLASTLGGGVVAFTGFSLIAATTPEEASDAAATAGDHPQRWLCASCETQNRQAARYCDQCGNRLG